MLLLDSMEEDEDEEEEEVAEANSSAAAEQLRLAPGTGWDELAVLSQEWFAS